MRFDTNVSECREKIRCRYFIGDCHATPRRTEQVNTHQHHLAIIPFDIGTFSMNVGKVLSLLSLTDANVAHNSKVFFVIESEKMKINFG